MSISAALVATEQPHTLSTAAVAAGSKMWSANFADPVPANAPQEHTAARFPGESEFRL